MAITNEAGKPLDVTKTEGQAENALPPVVELSPEEAPASTEQTTSNAAKTGFRDPAKRGFAAIAGFTGSIAADAAAIADQPYSPNNFFSPRSAGRGSYQQYPRSDIEIEYDKRCVEAIVSDEIFYANYISKLVSIMNEDAAVVEKAVLLLQGLRRIARNRTMAHLKNDYLEKDDPFFVTIVPGLKTAMFSESVEIVHDMPLPEYLGRMSRSNPGMIDPFLKDIVGGELIRIAITANKDDTGYHVILLPEPGHLLHAIAAGELQIN